MQDQLMHSKHKLYIDNEKTQTDQIKPCSPFISLVKRYYLI